VVITLGILFCGTVPNSHAYSVAVLPVADLTYDRDGVNFTLTEQLAEQLRRQGLDVIDQNRVLSFMMTERIRRCDEIDSFSARKMANYLGSDTVLQATVYSHDKTADQSSIVMTLLHGKTGQPLWSETVSGHLNDSQPIFGINGQYDLSTLQNDQLTELARHLAEQHPSASDPLSDLPPVQIEDIRIDPPLVRSGQPIQCRVKIDFLGAPPKQVVLQGGEQSISLRPTGTDNTYRATLTSKTAEGDHNIDMTFRWPTGEQTTINTISAYRVANTPVQLSLSFYNSMKIGDAYAFSEDIKIHPRMKPSRPLELWRIVMRDSQGEIVFSETQ
jgi:TolB-like protein